MLLYSYVISGFCVVLVHNKDTLISLLIASFTLAYFTFKLRYWENRQLAKSMNCEDQPNGLLKTIHTSHWRLVTIHSKANL